MQGEINALRTQLGLEPDDDLSGSITELQNELAKLRQDVEDANTTAMTAKLNKLATAIGVVDSTDLDAHVQATTAKPATATDGDDPHAISGWNGASYSVKSGTSTIMTVVYNDKAADTASTFNKRFTIRAATETVKPGHVQVLLSDAKLVGISGLPTHPSHQGVEIGPVNGVRGTLAGAQGLFTTDQTGGIRVGINDTNGAPTWTATQLYFKPDSATASVMMPDTTYMNLGWWLTMAANGDPTDVMVAAWGTGDAYDASTDSRLQALIGKATFNGIAVGKYTHKTINSISGGHFNADAELVADWGAGDADGTLTGTIDNFMQDGEAFGEGWKVELAAARTGTGTADDPFVFNPKGGATITATGAVDDTANGALGTFGTQKTYGTWNAMFRGNDRNDNMPSGVTGTFHVGETSHPVNMVGAFAAANQEADQPKN